MKYTCPIKLKEGIDMETTFYTFTANEIIVTGAGVQQVSGNNVRRMVCLRHSGSAVEQSADGRVIDFSAWRAAHDVEENVDETEVFEEEVSAGKMRKARNVRDVFRGMDLDQVVSAALIAVSVFACVGVLF